MVLAILEIHQGQLKRHFLIQAASPKVKSVTVVADELTLTNTGKPVFIVKNPPYQLDISRLKYSFKDY